MDIYKNIRIDLNKEEREAVKKVSTIVADFCSEGLCEKISSCDSCPLVIFCSLANNTEDFETTLNDIANKE